MTPVCVVAAIEAIVGQYRNLWPTPSTLGALFGTLVTREKTDRSIGLITCSELWAALETAKEERAGRLATSTTEVQPGARSLSS